MALTNGQMRRRVQSGRNINGALDAQRKDTVAVLTVTSNQTINARTAADAYKATAALTADRTVTLTNGQLGDTITFSRLASSTGAFNLTVAGKALTVGTWATVKHDGTAWYVAAAGTL